MHQFWLSAVCQQICADPLISSTLRRDLRASIDGKRVLALTLSMEAARALSSHSLAYASKSAASRGDNPPATREGPGPEYKDAAGVDYADAWIEDQDFKDPDSGQLLDRISAAAIQTPVGLAERERAPARAQISNQHDWLAASVQRTAPQKAKQRTFAERTLIQKQATR
jgi:hypothetical protein